MAKTVLFCFVLFCLVFYLSDFPASKPAQGQPTPNPNGAHQGLVFAGPSPHCLHGPRALPVSKQSLALYSTGALQAVQACLLGCMPLMISIPLSDAGMFVKGYVMTAILNPVLSNIQDFW